MLLYLIAIQGIAVLASHLFSTKTSSTVFTVLVLLAMTFVGGFSIHMTQIPFYLLWIQFISPERWILPILVASEYSPETLANTVAQQKCRNKQVCFVYYMDLRISPPYKILSPYLIPRCV